MFTGRPLLARRLHLISRRATIIAPRGEFSEGALALKVPKKAAYRTVATLAGLHRQLTWQASSAHELTDIQRFIEAREDDIVIALNLPARGDGAMLNRNAKPWGAERLLRPVADYNVPNVSDKVLRIILNYTDYVNRNVWKKY